MSRIPVAIIKQFVHFIFCPIPSVAARLCLSLHIKDDFAPHNLMTGEGEIIARGENDLVMVILSLSLIISFHFGSAICHSSQGDHSVFCPSSYSFVPRGSRTSIVAARLPSYTWSPLYSAFALQTLPSDPLVLAVRRRAAYSLPVLRGTHDRLYGARKPCTASTASP